MRKTPRFIKVASTCFVKQSVTQGVKTFIDKFI